MSEQSLDIVKRLRYAIENSPLSYVELEKKTGIAKSSIQRYASGATKKVPIDAVEKIAVATGFSSAWIMGWDSEKLLPPTITEDIVTFPVIGEIAAGYDEIAIEDWSGDTVDIPRSYLRGRKESDFFVLSVIGNSMYPMYHNGDKVLILKQSTLDRSGDIGAILYDGECATLKKVEYVQGENWMKLIPLNPEFMPKLIKNAELEQCRVLGIPKLLIREIE